MQTVISVFKDIYSYFKPTSKKRATRLAILILVLAVSAKFLFLSDNSEVQSNSNQSRIVETALVSSFNNLTQFELIGTVEAVSQAEIQAEAAGRVTKVNVSLGQDVRAGQVIAQLENASEYAAVLQAEGAYEAAQATAAQSDVGVNQTNNAIVVALNNSSDSLRNSYNSAKTVVLGSIDVFFSNPTEGIVGKKISGGNTSSLNTQRVSLRTILDDWGNLISQPITEQNAIAELDTAISYTQTVIQLIDDLLDITTDADNSELLNELKVSSYSTTLLANKQTLNGELNTLSNAKTTLLNAQDSLLRAKLQGTGGAVSAADAQVKQALGVLRAAQANYNKTVLTTPIAGVVNVLDIKIGDFVNAFTEVAVVANNNALEITTFVGESDKELLTVGQSVLIEKKFDGIVTNISPAINPITKKIEVKIQTETSEIANGDTVIVSIIQNENTTDETVELVVPLTAVKFSAQDGFLYSINDGIVVQHPVTLGDVKGSVIVLIGGVDANLGIITDARGLNVGQEVETTSIE